MTGPIDPIRPVRLVRRERPQPAADESVDAPVVNVTINVAPTPEPAPTPILPTPDAATHMIAQEARVRGLRGGPKVLQAARSAYLETEWSGPNDRRAHTGQIAKKDV